MLFGSCCGHIIFVIVYTSFLDQLYHKFALFLSLFVNQDLRFSDLLLSLKAILARYLLQYHLTIQIQFLVKQPQHGLECLKNRPAFGVSVGDVIVDRMSYWCQNFGRDSYQRAIFSLT